MTKHQEALERLNLKPGDRVRVVRKANDYEDGWDNNWTAPMDRAVGKVFAAANPGNNHGVRLDCPDVCGRIFTFPAHCLERVDARIIDCTIPE